MKMAQSNISEITGGASETLDRVERAVGDGGGQLNQRSEDTAAP